MFDSFIYTCRNTCYYFITLHSLLKQTVASTERADWDSLINIAYPDLTHLNGYQLVVLGVQPVQYLNFVMFHTILMQILNATERAD